MTSTLPDELGAGRRPAPAAMLNKVPAITASFWVIKVLGTTVGETAADYLDDTLGLGLNTTSVVVGLALALAFVAQLRARRYVPAIYWLVVVLISVAGTLMTDNLVDGHGVSLDVTTIGFAAALGLTFLGWFRSERTLSIHTIVTTRRECWYWLTVLFTFALGTSAGDLVSESLDIGYWKTGLIFLALIGLVALAYFRFGMGEVLSFWLAYILTRPLGASLGDYLLQPPSAGGLGLGTGPTTFVFLAVIVGAVAYLSVSGVDAQTGGAEDLTAPSGRPAPRAG